MFTRLKFFFSVVMALCFFTQPSFAKVNIFACEPEWGALAQEIGGDKVAVTTATTALQDPHQIQARPSLIAAVRRADLVFCTGAELEIGWLPMILEKASNPAVLPGQNGYLMAADYAKLLEVPTRLDRADGDVHAQGNPHIQLNPHHYLPLANALVERLTQLDNTNAAVYQTRYQQFVKQWQQNIARWENLAKPLHQMAIVVNHDNWSYLNEWLQLKQITTLEPKPGIPPSTAYLERILTLVKQQPAKAIIYASYESPNAAQWLSQKTAIPVLQLPFTVGGNAQANSLAGLFEDTIQQLLAVNHAAQ
ncbi:MAG: periplasmic solute-binding protein [Gammaproteobacteria bacterium]|jgi:zinc/manganese transport system substrate-binding protein|nr:periplasmic solute-binding protein [Gammaproteobacteria bacterium]